MTTETTQEEKKTKKYEISFLLTSPDQEKEVENVLSKNEVKVLSKNELSEIQLAYEIQKHGSAHFGFYNFEAAPENISKLETDLKAKSGVLRFLIVSAITARPPRPARQEMESQEGEQRPSPSPAVPQKAQVEEPAQRAPAPQRTDALTNEALEEKLEEILK